MLTCIFSLYNLLKTNQGHREEVMSAPNSSAVVLALAERARRVRLRSLRMVHAAKLGHPGGDFSAADILTVLYGNTLNVNSASPLDPNRDRFILSKGHCSAALYATLAESGFVTDADLDTYMKPLSRLSGHPDRKAVPGVEANTGPLGHGLPIAAGCALAARMQGRSWRTFVLVGDGELQEGSNWEAAMTAAQYRLDNLTLIVDRNQIQQGDFTEQIIQMEPLAAKWTSFGWGVREVNGHDIPALIECMRTLPIDKGKPSCVIARTTKGKGVSFMENKPEWHHHVPSDAELAAAVAELEGDGH